MDLISDHISHRFGALAVLDDVSFTVRAGEVVAIVGPSGCGKSTLLSILGGLLQPSGGRAEWRGAPHQPFRFSRQLPKAIVRRHAPARRHCPRAGGAARDPVDGRAAVGAGFANPRIADGGFYRLARRWFDGR